MTTPETDDRFRLNQSKLPKQISIDLSPEVAKHLQQTAAKTGRSIDELILNILDQHLQGDP